MKVYKLHFNNQILVFGSPNHLAVFLEEEIEANMELNGSIDFKITHEIMSAKDFEKLNEFEGVPIT